MKSAAVKLTIQELTFLWQSAHCKLESTKSLQIKVKLKLQSIQVGWKSDALNYTGRNRGLSGALEARTQKCPSDQPRTSNFALNFSKALSLCSSHCQIEGENQLEVGEIDL